MGHEPNCFCFYGLSGGTLDYDGYTCWPNSDYNAWGNDVIKLHVERSKAELLITLLDLFVLDDKIWSEISVPWIPWTPLDSVGIGSATERMLHLASHPVAMSHFGADQMRAVASSR
jgi:hypothetical protein